MEPEREYWARVIREVLRLSGLTVQGLADRLKVDSRTVKYWKSGKRSPKGMTTVRLYEYRVELYDKLGTVVHSEGSARSIVS